MSYGQSQNTYQQGPPQEAGYGYGQANPYGNGQNQYELQDYNNNNQYQAPPQQSRVLSQNEFLDRTQALRRDISNLTANIETIGQLHQRSLGSTDSQASQQLEQYVTQTQIQNTAIKDGIKGLERDLARTNDSSRNAKAKHLKTIKETFESELRRFLSVESDYNRRYRDQIARQYRIVNPDAPEEEVQQAANMDWGNEGVFQTALRTNRTGHATSVLGNVRARHNELQRIEQTMAELSRLFEDLAAQVEMQEETVVAAEEQTNKVNENLDAGNAQVEIANKHARNRRKLKWWCLGIVILIILIAVGVGAGVACSNGLCNNK